MIQQASEERSSEIVTPYEIEVRYPEGHVAFWRFFDIGVIEKAGRYKIKSFTVNPGGRCVVELSPAPGTSFINVSGPVWASTFVNGQDFVTKK